MLFWRMHSILSETNIMKDHEAHKMRHLLGKHQAGGPVREQANRHQKGAL